MMMYNNHRVKVGVNATYKHFKPSRKLNTWSNQQALGIMPKSP